jgi:hypothetical protein
LRSARISGRRLAIARTFSEDSRRPAGGTFDTATGIGVSELVEDVVLDACVLAAPAVVLDACVLAAPAVVLDACVLTARARPVLTLAAAAAEGAWGASEASSASVAIASDRIARA